MPSATNFLSRWQRIFALLYLCAAGVAAWQTVRHTNAATAYFNQACEKRNLRNEGIQVADASVGRNKIIGAFIVDYIHHKYGLPSLQDSNRALAEVQGLEREENREESLASFWSWLLLGLSCVYVLAAALQRRSDWVRNVLFALTGVSAALFVVGISAAVLVIYTTISNFFGTTPVVQHEVRSVVTVIQGLFATGHWIFAGYITLFSIGTPSVKIALNFFASLTPSSTQTRKISKFLNAIDKWSMTDVFVAAVLLACFTIKSGEGTHVTPGRGLYYFAGYCMLSMLTTSLMERLPFAGEEAPAAPQWIGVPAIAGTIGVVLFLVTIYVLAT